MNKKEWAQKLDGIKKLKDEAEFNKKRAEDNIEELDAMIQFFTQKIKSLK